MSAADETEKRMNEIVLLFPHQLFEKHAALNLGLPVFLIEEFLFFKQYKFHKQKLVFHRASMKAHQAFLESSGVEVDYIESKDASADIRVLLQELASGGLKKVHIINPTDDWLSRRVKKKCDELEIALIEYESPLFINNSTDLAGFFRTDKKSFFQTSFYKQQRKQRDILMDGPNLPTGGKWTFDVDNRKPYPKDEKPPKIAFPKADKYWIEAKTYVEENFSENYGQVSAEPLYPYTKHQSNVWLQQFFETRLHQFGDYEDAIVKDASILNHSVLTPMMNVGLLEPLEIVNAAIEYATKHKVPVNSLEGFVRQIMGWREFIRGMYECKGVQSRTTNFWGFKRKIPSSFYDGTTGIIPIDETILKVNETGYCHHIERLMILGNFMLLCEFAPDEVYAWFMELFIDAYDWVMVPNVYGMSQFADGGLFATKPYISGSNYVMKMSDYQKGEWNEIWDGLFWRFIQVNRDFFSKNPRLNMMVRTLDKMNAERKERLLQKAEGFLKTM